MGYGGIVELLTKLFITHGAVQAVLALSLTIALGILLGRIRIFGVSFGIGGILFSGIILGHLGFSLDQQTLVFTREFGLILFVFAIGMQVGPTFLESLRDQGLKLNLMAMFIVACGACVAVVCYYAFGLTIPQTAGLFSGAVTNTPALGSANEAWSQVAGSPELVSSGLQTIGMAYAVAYPFGILGIILTMMILKGLFHIDVAGELEAVKGEHASGVGAGRPARAGETARDMLVTNGCLAGRRLGEILPPGIGVNRITRAGADFAYDPAWKMRLMDTVSASSADEGALEGFAGRLGNNAAALQHPQMLSIFLGIFFGVLVGSIPVFVPGLPTGIKLGVAGGTLLTAIFLGRKQRFAGLTFFMSPGSNNLMRELGILLFLACVGLHAGQGFVETVIHGPGLRWMGLGALITFVPLFLAAVFCRAFWKINFPSICGMLAGSMTDPPALAFAMQYYGGRVSAMAYSTVYPLTMILRILAGQLLVLILSAI